MIDENGSVFRPIDQSDMIARIESFDVDEDDHDNSSEGGQGGGGGVQWCVVVLLVVVASRCVMAGAMCL